MLFSTRDRVNVKIGVKSLVGQWLCTRILLLAVVIVSYTQETCIENSILGKPIAIVYVTVVVIITCGNIENITVCFAI